MIANAAVQAAAKGRVVIDFRPLAEEAFGLEGLRIFKVVIALVDVADVRHQQGAFRDAVALQGKVFRHFP